MENTDFDIEILDTESKEETEVNLPLNFLAFGEIESDDVRVYIKQNVYKELEKFACSDTNKELGSILFGEYYNEMGKTHVIISDYIEAKYTDASAATLTFTHESWDYIHREHEKKFPQKKIIGWQHTHPSYGIFLSNYDMFIQENFFNLPFQVAYVIDPVQRLRGFFQWKNGNVEKLKGFYVYDDVNKCIKIEQHPENKPLESGRKHSKGIVVLLTLLCALCVLFSVSLISVSQNYKELIAEQEAISEKQQELINKQSEDYDLLEGIILDDADLLRPTTVETLIELLENNEYAFSNQDAVLKTLKDFSDNSAENNKAFFVLYTVKSGDNLYTICKNQNIDYEANARLILSLNGISDPDTIWVGQNLLIPSNVIN